MSVDPTRPPEAESYATQGGRFEEPGIACECVLLAETKDHAHRALIRAEHSAGGQKKSALQPPPVTRHQRTELAFPAWALSRTVARTCANSAPKKKIIAE
jgi:hypothetical protein